MGHVRKGEVGGLTLALSMKFARYRTHRTGRMRMSSLRTRRRSAARSMGGSREDDVGETPPSMITAIFSESAMLTMSSSSKSLSYSTGECVYQALQRRSRGGGIDR